MNLDYIMFQVDGFYEVIRQHGEEFYALHSFVFINALQNMGIL